MKKLPIGLWSASADGQTDMSVRWALSHWIDFVYDFVLNFVRLIQSMSYIMTKYPFHAANPAVKANSLKLDICILPSKTM